jgi:outer membrane lipoprotein
MTRRWFFATILALSLTGCIHAIPKEILSEVDREISFTELQKAPKTYEGKVVLLGGVLVSVLNQRSGTLLVIYQTEIDREGRPVNLDKSGGRFLAFYRGFLDSAIYRKGRQVTLAAAVKGMKFMKLGELDYRHPYLVIKAIHLWRTEPPVIRRAYPWGIWGPWWADPWYPWHIPYWRYR